VVFGPKPRSYETSLNKKERKAALRAALSDRFQRRRQRARHRRLRLDEDARFRDAALRFAQGGEDGVPKTLVVFAESEAATVGARLERVGATSEQASA
jgi:ribosomal protein L4